MTAAKAIVLAENSGVLKKVMLSERGERRRRKFLREQDERDESHESVRRSGSEGLYGPSLVLQSAQYFWLLSTG